MVEGISDGIDADSFIVSGTAIFGSQSVALSSIIRALSPIDTDELLELTLTLSSEFISVDGSSGFYNTASNQFLTDPVTLSGAQSQISSFLNSIEIKTSDEQSSFSVNASAASIDDPDSLSASVSKQIFISSTPLSTPELVASDGSPISPTFTLTEGERLFLTCCFCEWSNKS